jgi:glycogen synthase
VAFREVTSISDRTTMTGISRKLAGAGILGLAALASPWLAFETTRLLHDLLGNAVPLSRGSLPGQLQLVALALATLVVLFAGRPLIATYLSADLRSAVLVSLVWAVTGTVLWLAEMFFVGSLSTLDRSFPLVQSVILAGMLATPRVLKEVGAIVWVQLLAVASALVVVQWWQAWPRITFIDVTKLEIDSFLRQVASPPVIEPLSFVAAALLASLVPHARIRRGMNFVGRMIHTITWIVLTHFIWLTVLFAFGAADVPRWLPILTGAIMGVVSLSVPIASAFRPGSSLVAGLYDSNRIEVADTKAELMPRATAGLHPGSRRAWVISYTGVSNEPRVLRQCEALMKNAWAVVVCGYHGHSERPSGWDFIRLPTAEPFGRSGHNLLSFVQKIGRLLLVFGCPAGMFEWAGRVVHGATPLWCHTRRELVTLAKAHPELTADLVISHDYHTADVGYAVAQVYGAKFSMDVHEYAAGQYFNDPHWVKWERPVAVSVQRYYLGKADLVTVVCQGIADLLAKENNLRREPVTIRSVPFKTVQPFRPVGRRIEVLYHGDVSVRREIHTLIESMRYWTDSIDLRLRGSGDPSYIAELKRRVSRLNLEGRVYFEPPAPFEKIIPAASASDIGFFSFKGNSPQIRFTLPNKFFEYIMAGLCLCVGETDEVARIVRQYRCGTLIPSHDPEAIAEAINGLTPDAIETFKKASIAAAEELNWEVERGRLMETYEGILESESLSNRSYWLTDLVMRSQRPYFRASESGAN